MRAAFSDGDIVPFSFVGLPQAYFDIKQVIINERKIQLF